jgi:NAD(P)-dependent dehydrogenase (short-subunit alcohol dehydrogenase family)
MCSGGPNIRRLSTLHQKRDVEINDSSPRLTASPVGSGIGLETSILFAREGARVLMTDISRARLDAALAKLTAAVPSPAAAAAVLVCNVAVDTPEAVWDQTMAVNVKGVWFGCKHAVLSLRRHGKTRASIVNVASVVALVGSATPQLAYTASKGAVLAMTRELAVVHAREGYRFNALCPAPLK